MVDAVQSPPAYLPLPNIRLIIDPGFYEYGGNVYDMTRGGFYLFTDLPDQQARIVWDGDIYSFLSGLAWVTSHGNGDNAKSNNDISIAAMTRKVSVACGKVSEWVLEVLGYVGVPARIAQAVSAGPLVNGDNGHAMVEVWDANASKWVLFDLDFNILFEQSGSPLDFISSVDAVKADSYAVRKLSSDAPFDTSGWYIDGTFYSYHAERVFLEQHDWRARVFASTALHDAGVWYFTSDPSDRSVIESQVPAWVWLDRSAFVAKFY